MSPMPVEETTEPQPPSLDENTNSPVSQTQALDDSSTSMVASHPYAPGAVLTLAYTPSPENNGPVVVQAVIRKAFLPFTKSQTLLVEFRRPVLNLPRTAVLKLYDRRYVNNREAEEQPWDVDRERAAIQRWRDVESGAAPDYDWDDEHGTTDDYDDGIWEEYFEQQTHYSYEMETGAYERLRSMQGMHIPRFFGTIKVEFSVDGICGPHQVIPGIVLEQLSGMTLEQQPSPDFVIRQPAAVAALLAAVDLFSSLGVIHGDIRGANIIAVRKPRPRLVLIDFGQAILRWEELSEERWKEIANRDDVADLRLALSRANVRDMSPVEPDHPSEPVPRTSYSKNATDRYLSRWLVPTDPPRTGIRIAERGPWFLMKPQVYQWLKTRNTRDPQYWLMPRPNEPHWTVL